MVGDLESTDRQLNKQEMRSQQSMRRLLHAASEILVEEGVAGLTLANVGVRAGYSRGLVTKRFGSKDNMIEALVHRLTSTWAAARVEPRIKNKSGLESVLELLREMRDQIVRNPTDVLALQALLFDALNPLSSAREPILEYNRSLRELFASHLENAADAGILSVDIDVARESGWLLEGIRGIGFNWLLEPERYDAAAALTHLIGVVDQRFSSAPPVKQRG